MLIYAKASPTAPQTEHSFLEWLFGRQFTGYFLDVGANDGVSSSNTRLLWERGWSGTLIEPEPDTFKRLLANYPVRDRLKFLNVAIATVDGPVTFYQHTDPNRAGWHSMWPPWVKGWEDGAAKMITVPAVKLSSLELPAMVDFLSLDTEGMDATILETMPETFRPRLIICEVDKQGARERIEREMDRRHYSFQWGTYLNSAYVRMEH